ncbi:hypothetical protein AMS68_002127 [Peltaster fructicola]|uniref:Uncharacterized protein n=1 Tax=Peltaster fructicola TaxID=286661 RepID=A0A6H0XQ56_9PEZI|nr:hypothetical protein AMS68_002127 [Peltaster fructicola]
MVFGAVPDDAGTVVFGPVPDDAGTVVFGPVPLDAGTVVFEALPLDAGTLAEAGFEDPTTLEEALAIPEVALDTAPDDGFVERLFLVHAETRELEPITDPEGRIDAGRDVPDAGTEVPDAGRETPEAGLEDAAAPEDALARPELALEMAPVDGFAERLFLVHADAPVLAPDPDGRSDTLRDVPEAAVPELAFRETEAEAVPTLPDETFDALTLAPDRTEDEAGACEADFEADRDFALQADEAFELDPVTAADDEAAAPVDRTTTEEAAVPVETAADDEAATPVDFTIEAEADREGCEILADADAAQPYLPVLSFSSTYCAASVAVRSVK